MLTHGMHYMANIVITKRVFEKYEKIYKDQQSWDFDFIVFENNNLK